MALLTDIRFACRALLRTPGFTLVAVLTLALGIGMSVAVWSVIDAVLIEPLPYPDSEKLVEIRMTEPHRGPGEYPMSALDYLDYAEGNKSFEAIAAVFRQNLNLSGEATPERVSGALVTAEFFDVFGIGPVLGRSISPVDDTPGADLVAVISQGLWQRRFDGAADVLGSTLVVDGRPHVVVGVAPEGLDFPASTDLWVPMALDPETEDRNHGWVVPVARLRSDVALDQARADLDRIAQRLEKMYPESNAGQGVAIRPLKETFVGGVRPSLLVLLAAVACVLLIASANVTILLSVRTAARQRELAVRHALGARRTHLVRLVVAESLTLAVAGGTAGLVLAWWLVTAAENRFADLIPTACSISFDGGVLGFALLLSVGVGLTAGALPALRSREDRIMAQLREADRSVAGAPSRIGTVMVLTEVALSVVLMAGAVLLVRTFLNLVDVDPGFDSERVLTAEVSLAGERYTTDESRLEFYREATEQISTIPGVKAAGTIYPLPLFSRRVSTVTTVEGAEIPADQPQRPLVDIRFVSPGYLEAAGLQLVAGRFFDGSDTSDSPAVVVVNESFIRHLCPGMDAVGRRTTGYDPEDPEAQWDTIVGVVRNVRHIDLADDAGPEMYFPVTQFPFEWATFTVRSRTDDATALAGPIREVIHRLDPELPVFHVQTMAEVVSSSLARKRVVTAMLVLFASVGLALAGVGVFSVVSFTVGRRLHEVAVRLALGGTPHRIVGLIIRQGLVPVGAGLLSGIVTAFILTRVLASHLYGVASHDPLTYSGTTLAVLGVSVLATWFPAQRAARVEPMEVLRTE